MWRTVTTIRGNTYHDWEEPLPGVPDRIRNSIIYLYSDRASADVGEETGASGFLLGMPSAAGPESMHVYAVTNAHVIDSGYPVVRVNLKYPRNGNERTEILDFPADSWIAHDVHDIAIRPFPVDLDLSILEATILDISYLLKKHEVESMHVLPGAESLYVGRFTRHGGALRNIPSVRFGNISMLPDDECPVEYECEGKVRRQVSFLVEARSRGGYSGSPVFLISELNMLNPRSPRQLWPEMEMRLLGIDWGHLLEDVQIRSTGQLIQINSGMMGVVPAWYLEEFISNSPRLVAQRNRDDEFYKRQRIAAQGAEPDVK